MLIHTFIKKLGLNARPILTIVHVSIVQPSSTYVLLPLQNLVESFDVLTHKRSKWMLNRNQIIRCVVDDKGYWTRLNYPM